MSLHKFAQDVASKGRGDDSLLIHMTPDEVQRLQAFAQANGRSLTINPDTGLPEAGMLSDLFKAVAPIALGAFLGPAGLAMGGGFLTAAQAGLAVGGITTLATGSLSRGLMAGLGAYGGAGLGESLMNAGSASLATQAMTPELMEQAAGAGANYDQFLTSEVGARTAASTPFDTLKAGASAVTDSGSAAMNFAKQNLGNLSAAAAPIMADMMVPTTTKMPENANPAYIRQKLYDPYTQTYKSLAPVKASEWGSRNFSDAYTNPQTGGIASLDQRQTTPMAAGGIVALAGGGDAALEAYQAGNFAEASRLLGEAGMSAQDVVSKYGLSQEAAAGVAKNLGYAGDMSGIQYADAAPAAPVAVSAPTAPATSYTSNRAAIEPEDTTVAPTGGLDSLAASQVQVPVKPDPYAGGFKIHQGQENLPPVTQPTAPAGIETLTAAMPPVPPVAPKVTDEQIKTWWSDPENQKLNDTQIKQVMLDNKVTPEQFANAIGANTATAADITSRYEQVGKPTGIQTLTADQTVTTADKAAADKAAADAAAKATGVFQTVYDPATGREFSSPAQALQYGVKDYVTEMPMKLEFLNDTSKKAVTDAMSRGMTFDQALTSLGGQFGMSGKDFYNYEMQGGIRSKDTALIQKAIDTESGGLTPEQLTAKLQAFKDKPPTTAKEFTEQQALYADYQRRYANSSWNYANMGGKAQDYSLKPKDYLATKFTGYADPINFALSNMKQNTTEFKEMSKILTANPEINDVIDQLYKINPEQSFFNAVNPKYAGGTEKSSMALNFNTSVKNLASDVEQFGADTAMRRFIGDQQNLLSLLPDAQGKLGNFNQKTMSNPEYRALNAIKDSYTPIADNAAWNKQASLGAPKGSTFSEPYRDSTTGKGLSLVYGKTGNITGVNFIDQSGMGQIVYNDPTKLIEAAYESGIPLSAFNEIAKKAGSDVFIPSQKGMRGGDYFPEGLKDGVKFSDIANGNLAKTIASPEWLNFMTKDAIDKETNLGNPEYAGGLNDKIAKLKNQNQIAKDYLADIGGGKTSTDPTGLAGLAANQTTAAGTQGTPTGVAALAANAGITAPSSGAAQFAAANNINLSKNISDWIAAHPNATDAQVDAEMAKYGVTGEDVAKALPQSGGSKGLSWALNQGNMGLSGLNKNIQDYVATHGNTATDRIVAENTLAKYGLNAADVKRATGKTLDELFAAKKTVEPPKVTPPSVVKPPPTQVITKGDGTTVTRVTEPTPIITAPEVVLPPGASGATGPSITGGGTTVNPNGTITTSPRIPNIPAGGFTGMESLRDSYTKGGGSLGYTPKTPKTAAEHAVAYNRMTGDSAAAYNYLMGKGAYPTQSVAASTSTGIMRPYFSEGMRYKPKFLSYDKEGNVTTSSTNPNAPKAGDVTNKSSAKSINVVDNQGNTVEAVLREDGKYHTSGGDTYDVTGKQIVAGGGMMGYANGGITGTGQLNLNIPLNLGGSGGGMGGTGGYNGYGAVGGGFGSSGGYQGQGSQNSVQQSGMPDFRNQLQGFESQIQKLPSVMSYNDYTKSVGNRPPTADEMAQIEQLRKGVIGDKGFLDLQSQMRGVESKYQQQAMGNQSAGLQQRYLQQAPNVKTLAGGGYAIGGGMGTLGSYSDGGRLLRGPGDGVSDSIPATIGRKQQPARLADGEFVIPARIVSELGNGSTDAGAKKLYAMMDRVQRARGKTTGKNKVAANSRADKYLPA